MDDRTLRTLKKRLKEEARKLMAGIRRSRTAEEEIRVENTGDPGDLAAIGRDRAVIYALHETDCQRLRSIQEALARVETGKYGLCSQCGDEIDLKRHTVIPWAAFCLPCQEEVEKRQRPSGPDVGYNIRNADFATLKEVIQ